MTQIKHESSSKLLTKREKRTAENSKSYRSCHWTILITRNLLKTGGELMCSGWVGTCSSCSTSDTRPVTFVTNPVMNEKRVAL